MIASESLFQRYFFLVMVCGFLSGCMVGPDFHSPAPPRVKNYTSSSLPFHTVSVKDTAGQAQYFVANQDIPAEWWTLFRSQSLNNLIQKGFAHSPTLEAAQAALHQAQENLNAQTGTLYPSANFQLADQRQKSSGISLGAPASSGSVFNLYNASVSVSYVFDIFGGSRRAIEAMRAQADYQQFEWEAAYLALTSNIVTTAITEASLREQMQAQREMIRLQEAQLQVVKKQFRLGGVSSVDVLSQETQLAQTRALLPPLEKSLTQTRHALSVLVGDFPSEDQHWLFSLNELKLPKHLPVSLPSSLVRQRPDVRASEALLQQASAQIGVATANLFPRFSFSGSYGSTAGRTADLLRADTNVWNLAANVLQPIFQIGLTAARKASMAAYDQAAAQYRQSVLHAFQDVADTLRALEFDARELQTQTMAEGSARKMLKITKQQFELGAVSYLSLLNSERQYQQTRIAHVQAQATRYADTAALFQALGGGWWNRTSKK